MLESNIQRGIILIPNRDGTIPTMGGFGGIIQIPAKVLNEIIRPRRACLAQRWIEDGKLLGVARDFETTRKIGRKILGKGSFL